MNLKKKVSVKDGKLDMTVFSEMANTIKNDFLNENGKFYGEV